MKQFGLSLFIGTLLSLPVLYILELRNPGAISLLLFLCIGFAATAILAIKSFRKKEQRND